VGSVCHVSASQLGRKIQLGSKHVADDEEVEMEVWKWLRQQSKDLYAVDFNVMVKR
jgi:hypothetical protein